MSALVPTICPRVETTCKKTSPHWKDISFAVVAVMTSKHHYFNITPHLKKKIMVTQDFETLGTRNIRKPIFSGVVIKCYFKFFHIDIKPNPLMNFLKSHKAETLPDSHYMSNFAALPLKLYPANISLQVTMVSIQNGYHSKNLLLKQISRRLGTKEINTFEKR